MCVTRKRTTSVPTRNCRSAKALPGSPRAKRHPAAQRLLEALPAGASEGRAGGYSSGPEPPPPSGAGSRRFPVRGCTGGTAPVPSHELPHRAPHCRSRPPAPWPAGVARSPRSDRRDRFSRRMRPGTPDLSQMGLAATGGAENTRAGAGQLGQRSSHATAASLLEATRKSSSPMAGRWPRSRGSCAGVTVTAAMSLRKRRPADPHNTGLRCIAGARSGSAHR